MNLQIVSTPIGNFLDITLRAIKTLQNSDIIICEDSRVSAKLLNHLKIKKPLLVYNDFSTQKDREKILNYIINEKKNLSLISDAGTPLISDPGHKLVSFLIDNGVKSISIPGACSAIAALSISGITSDRFMFAGFLPHQKQKRENTLQDLKPIKAALIFFESPRRLADSLEIILKVLGNRMASVIREISKIYEEVRKDNITKLLEHYQARPIKGEVVIIVSPANKNQKINIDEIEEEIITLLQNTKPKDLVKLVSQNYSLDPKEVYQKILEIKKKK